MKSRSYLLLFLFLALHFVGKGTHAQQDDWREIDIGTNQNLNSISIWRNAQDESPEIMMVAGDNGTIFRSTDAGESWTQIASNTTKDLVDLFYTSEAHWVATGLDGIVLFSDDGGINWEERTPPKNVDYYGGMFYHYDGDENPTIFVHGAEATIYKTKNYGDSWTKVNPLYPFDTFFSGCIVDYGEGNGASKNNETQANLFGMFLGGESSIYKSEDGGDTWLYIDLPCGYIITVHMVNRDKGYALGTGGKAVTSDGGETWNPTDMGTDDNLNSVGFGVDEPEGWGGGNKGKVVHTTDQGETWQEEDTGDDRDLLDVEAYKSEVYITGTNGRLVTDTQLQQAGEYTLTTSILPEDAQNAGCSVSKIPNQLKYFEGTTVKLSAGAAPGWTFVEWRGDLSGTDNPQNITMNSNKNVTAVFEELSPDERVLTVNISPPEAADNGCSTIPDVGLHQYDLNSEINVHAIPNQEAGWFFKEWTGDVGGTELSAHLVMDDDKDVTANFELVELTVSGSKDAQLFCPEELMEENYQQILPVTLCANEIDGWNISKIQFRASGTGADDFDTKLVKVQKGGEVIYDGYYSYDNGTLEATFDPPMSIGPTECVTLSLYYLFEFNADTYAADEGKTFLVETNSVTATPWEHSEGLITGKAESQGIRVGRIYTSRDFVFGNINQAIESENTQDGDICYVCPGTYTENVELVGDNKGLTLKSKEGKEKTFITFDENNADASSVILIGADNANIDGFTINGNNSKKKSGVTIDAADNVKIINNSFGGLDGKGIEMKSANNNIISDNYFLAEEDAIGRNCSPIYLDSSNGNTISNNSIKLNYDPSHLKDDEIFLSHSKNNIIENNYSNPTFDIALTEGSNENKVLSNKAEQLIGFVSLISLSSKSNHNQISGNQEMRITCKESDYNYISENETNEIEVIKSKHCTIDNNIVTERELSTFGGINVGTNGKKYGDKFHYITNNKVYDNELADGITIENTENTLVSGNTSYRNHEFGIHVFNSNKMELKGNKSSYNGGNVFPTDGIHIDNVTNIDIVDNISTHHENGTLSLESYGLRILNSSGVYIAGNIFINNCTGMELDNVSNVFVGINTITNSICLFTGMSLKNTNPVIYGNNILNNNGVGIHLGEGATADLSNNNIYGNTIHAVQNDNPEYSVNLNNNFWGSENEPEADMFAGDYQLTNWLTEDAGIVISHPKDTVYVKNSGEDTLNIIVSNLKVVGDELTLEFEDDLNWLQVKKIENVITDTAGVEVSIPLNLPSPLPKDVFNKITISASGNDQSNVQDSLYVYTYNAVLNGFDLFPDSTSYIVGDSISFYAAGYDQLGNPMNFDPVWSTSKGTITANGVFFAEDEYELVEITAIDSVTGNTSSSTIYVSSEIAELSSITIKPQTITLNPGDEIHFTTFGYDNNGMRFDFNPIWHASGGRISYNGIFQADTIEGTFSVSVTDTLTNISDEAQVIISNTTGVSNSYQVPMDYSLSQNYPNPFNPVTQIQASLPFDSNVKLEIYNILGERVDILTDKIELAGYKTYSWKPNDLASGVYFIRMVATSVTSANHKFIDIKKMIYLK